MINKLTKAQEQDIIKTRDEWLNHCLSLEFNEHDAIEGINFVYTKLLKKDKPRIYIMDCPLSVQVFANILSKNQDNIREKIIYNIRDNLSNNLSDNISDNIWENISDNIRNNIWENISDNIRNNIWDNICDNISDNLREKIRNNISENIRNNISDNISDNIWDNICDNISDNLREKIRNNIWNNLRNNLSDNISENIWEKIRNNIRENISENIRENIWKNIRDNLSNNIRENLSDNISDNIRNNISNNISDNIWDNISDNIRNNIWKNIGDNIWNNISYNIRDKIRNKIWENISNNISDNISDNIRDNIMDNICNNINNNIWENIRNNICNNLSDNISDNIWDNICNNISDNISDNISENIRDNIGYIIHKLKLEYMNFSYYMDFSDSSLCAYYDYFIKHGLIKGDFSLFEKYKKLIKSNIFLSCCFENVVILSKPPVFLNRDENGRLHSTHDKAICFKSGYGEYYVHGVRFDKDIFKKCFIDKTITSEDILSISNAEQKAVIIQEFGFDKIFKDLKTKTILDKQIKRFNKTGKTVEYTLFSVNVIDNVTSHIIKVEWWEKNRKRETLLGVPNTIKDAIEAVAWTLFTTKQNYEKNMLMEA